MRGFTKTGQPIMGRTYIIRQEGVGIPGDELEVKVVGKFYGTKGNADLVAVLYEDVESGGRFDLPWPIEATLGAPEITFRAK